MERSFPSLGTYSPVTVVLLWAHPGLKSANAYWVGLSGLATNQLAESFSYIGSAGATVVRTWYAPMLSAPLDLWFNQIQGISRSDNHTVQCVLSNLAGQDPDSEHFC